MLKVSIFYFCLNLLINSINKSFKIKYIGFNFSCSLVLICFLKPYHMHVSESTSKVSKGRQAIKWVTFEIQTPKSSLNFSFGQFEFWYLT